ncbi:NPR2-domain-containing protein [Auriscalpium vulgare]|uniref:NPR2-domain-containing protein n=1 Tax=Auriscalpium vulgare TaxID=40419 RepID=A0ACB8RAG4_9AGAM|nr:NPR2-domain-containing protein [Auriscalpium vulgare]
MAAQGDSFLPRLQSVFYAVFDVLQGPKIAYQVPEGLILSTSAGTTSFSSSPIPSSTPSSQASTASSRASSISLSGPPLFRPDSRAQKVSPQKRPLSANRTLFHFDDISKYVIPPSPLCGRLVMCTTDKCKVSGFPTELRGNYERNYFRFNVCFVFERGADLSCYEPIVRKVNRVFANCEDESGFLSSPETSPKIHAILEQLYEDLNSYSETSIPVDTFNSIELKIFPFYPNPPAVKDWMVPLSLINLTKIVEPNWDLTMAKVCQYIDGTNHVSRIAHLAKCDVELTRQAIAHLLYYQVIMTIDIFQYSNMYKLRKSIQWLADEPNVKEECGPYISKEGRAIPDWPKLLHLYSRMKPGKTVFDWMQDHDVRSLGIDVRRFTSFGVIKGFLRRVHRWPVLLAEDPPPAPVPAPAPQPSPRKRALSLTLAIPAPTPAPPPPPSLRVRRRASDLSPPLATVTTSTHSPTGTVSPPPRATDYLHTRGLRTSAPHPPSLARSPPAREGRRSTVTATSLYELAQALASPTAGTSARTFATLPARPRPSRSPSSPALKTQANGAGAAAPAVQPQPQPYPPTLLPLLDGEHHTDELCTRFEVGWPTLEKWLAAAGGGAGSGDFGRVLIIYR